jgi:prepilin-type N-terminal cleavage/methylation domain-containing protein
MKKAFTLLELIFVIVLIGVLSGIAFYMNRPDGTRSDAQYTLLKLKEARYRAIGDDTSNGTALANGCVTLTKTALSNNETPVYTIKSSIPPILALSNEQTVCFDTLGRPHNGNSTTLNTLFTSDVNITFQSSTHTSEIKLYKQTGYAIITC